MIKGLVICIGTWLFAISDAVFDVLVQFGMVWLMLRLSESVVGEDGRALEACEWGKGCHNTVENHLKIEKLRERKGNK
ncbi:hypothetical protein EDB19DRAFT_1773650 [Suillus lakei]|nr:hypothetical protein EDB19DRAFT_1773650 [Suillus lakei]